MPVFADKRRQLTRRRFLGALGHAAGGIALGCGKPAVAAAESYDGMHDGAAWRQAALARIEQQRKADFSVTVVDAAGKPLEAAVVELALQRHAFGFGGGVRVPRLFDRQYPAELRERYRSLASSQFHKIVAVNAMKWKHIDDNERLVEDFLDWCKAEDLPVRGHTLVWPRFRRAPWNIERLAEKPEELRAAIRAHIRRMVATYKGRVAEWDVLNEPYTEHVYMDIIGDDVALDWFHATREDDPDAIRYINDFGVLTRPNNEHRDFYYEYVGWLLDNGAPLQGIGFQAHNPAQFPLESPENMLQTLDRFAAYGLDMQITEFDVERTDRELQARYTMDFLIAVFSHPATVGLLTWTPFEFGNNVVSKPDAAFFDRHLQPRPNGQVWDLLVNQQWRTRDTGATSADGEFGFRGFPGQYSVRVAAGSAVHEAKAEFLPHHSRITVSLT